MDQATIDNAIKLLKDAIAAAKAQYAEQQAAAAPAEEEVETDGLSAEELAKIEAEKAAEAERLAKEAEEREAARRVQFQNFLEENSISVKPLGVNSAGIEMLELDTKDLVQAAKLLKRSKQMKMFTLLTALELKRGFQSVVQLQEMDTMQSVVLKVTVDRANPVVPTLSDIYPAADWAEREAYDMFGIQYEGHPNLVRILNPDNWEGFPLRRDYIGPVDELNQPLNYATR